MSCANTFTPEATRTSAEGVPFTLADRQVWHLAVPKIRLRPRVVKTPVEMLGLPYVETIEIDSRWDYPPGVRERVQALIDEVRSENDELSYSAIVNAAVPLVRLCHDITAEQAATLFEMTSEEMEDLAVGMLRMFRGNRPQPETEEQTYAIES